jgi:hypothetical protein
MAIKERASRSAALEGTRATCVDHCTTVELRNLRGEGGRERVQDFFARLDGP